MESLVLKTEACKSVARVVLSPRLLLVLIALAVSSPAWASLSACPVSPASATLSTYQPPDASTGCTSGNLKFTNFVIGTDAGSTINGTLLVNSLTNSHGDVVVTPLPATQISLTTGYACTTSSFGCTGLQFFNPPPFTNDSTNQSFCSSNSGSKGFCIQGENLSVAHSITYTMETIAAGTTFSQLGLGATVEVHNSGSGVNTGATSVVFREYCLGTSVFSQTVCPGGYGVLQVGVFNAKFQTLSGSVGATFNPVSLAAIRDTVYLLTNNGEGAFADVQLFQMTLDSPEPATFGLMGLSLAGLAFLRRRRKA